jgi:hypothetical protein
VPPVEQCPRHRASPFADSISNLAVSSSIIQRAADIKQIANK